MSKEKVAFVKSFKYRIYPNKEQEEYLAKTFGCCRFVYNGLLAESIEEYKNHKENQIHTLTLSLIKGSYKIP